LFFLLQTPYKGAMRRRNPDKMLRIRRLYKLHPRRLRESKSGVCRTIRFTAYAISVIIVG